MNLKRSITILTMGALAVAAAIGIVAYRSANAAAPAAAAVPGRVYAHMGAGGEFGGGIADEDLADALGISVDELTAAYAEAKEAAIDQALEAGLITEAQAEQLRANSATFPFGRRWGGWLSENGIDYEALLADALGITVDELYTAYTEAYNARIDRAVSEGELTEEQADLLKGRRALFTSESFRTAMQSAFEAAVQQAVEQGVITQSQADRILEAVTDGGFRGFMDFGGFGRGPGFGRHGGPGGWLPGDPGTVEPEVTPSDGL